jgi:hypothetical protein
MKRGLAVVTVALIVTVLATCFMGNSCVLAEETSNTTRLTDSNIKGSQFEMPVITINTVTENKISSDKAYTDAQISIINAKGNYEMTKTNMSIKLRGNSSMYADKASYKMKFDKKQNLLNIGNDKGKSWCLIANYYDGSLLRNLTTYHIADFLTAMPYSPNCRSIELYVNGEYQGVYLLCEEVNVSKNRVAITEEPDKVEDNGYLVEMSRYTKENMFKVDTASYVIESELSENESTKKQQIDYISNYITKSYNSLINGNKKEVEKYINIDSLVDIYIGNEIIKNVDAGWDSFYMYKDDDGKLCFGPMWDYDLAMGNANCTKGCDSWIGFNPYHVLNLNANSNPWFSHALSYKWFRELVKTRWNKLKNEINGLPDFVINEAESNIKSYCRNFEKWDDILGKQVYIEPTPISALTTYKDHYTYLSNWLGNRVKWLADYYNGKDFIEGIFVNEEGKVFSADSNLLEISPILALKNALDVDLTYVLSPNIGISMDIKNAGSETWSIQADASGFMMEKGAEYVLSFDYKCSQERKLSFNIQQNYEPYSSYYSDNVNATNELKHYEATLAASASDSNCALIFSLGGDTFNGTVVTLDNMSLVKKTVSPTQVNTINTKSVQNPNITRAEFVSLLAYLAGADLKEYTSSKFSDVKTTARYNGAVQWAYKKGIISGIGGKINPNANVTCQEMVTMLYKYAKAEGADVSNIEGNAIDEFFNVGEISTWAKDPIRWAINENIIYQNDNNAFSPKSKATRVEAAALISRLLQKIVE